MKTIQLLEILGQYPMFSESDVAKILRKKPEYIKTLLYRLKANKLINRIERGKYTVHDDILIFASQICTPSYISLWTALRYYNLTEQLPRTIFVVVPRTKKSLTFENTEIKFIKTKHFFGYRKEHYSGFDIFVAEPEKAVIDSLLAKKIPFDEAVKAINSKEINIKILISYALKIKNKTLAKRLGFILEEAGYKCDALNMLTDSNYIALDYSLKRKGKKNKKWRVIDNRK